MPAVTLNEVRSYSDDAGELSRQVGALEDNVREAVRSLAELSADRFSPTNKKTANYTAAIGELVTIAATMTLALPAATALVAGKSVAVSLQAGTATVVTVSGTVQGAASDSLSTVGLYLYVCDGAGWRRAPTSGAGGAVSSVTASGAGITASPTTGAVVVANTGVTSLAGGAGVAVSGSTGAVTVSLSGTSGTANLAFGAYPGRHEQFVFVSAPTIGASSAVNVMFDANGIDDPYIATLVGLSVTAPTAGVGFTIYARSIHKIQGTQRVLWSWR